MPNGKKKKRHKMSTHKRKSVCARTVTRASKSLAGFQLTVQKVKSQAQLLPSDLLDF